MDQNSCRKDGENGEVVIWEVITLFRRMDRQGEVLIWCRKCSGYARQRMGPKLMSCCRPEQMDTKEFGKMVKRIQTWRKEESQPKRQKIGKSREKRKELRERNIKGC